MNENEAVQMREQLSKHLNIVVQNLDAILKTNEPFHQLTQNAFNNLEQYVELIEKRMKPELMSAVLYLKKMLDPYKESHDKVLKACSLIDEKLNDKNIFKSEKSIFNQDETTAIAAAIHDLKNTHINFFTALDQFFTEPNKRLHRASYSLLKLQAEIEGIDQDIEIRKKLSALPLAAQYEIFLPKEVNDYLKILNTDELFDRIQNKGQQLKKLEELNDLLCGFAS